MTDPDLRDGSKGTGTWFRGRPARHRRGGVVLLLVFVAAILAVPAAGQGDPEPDERLREAGDPPLRGGVGDGALAIDGQDPAAAVDSLLTSPMLSAAERIVGLERLLEYYEAPDEPWAYRAANQLGRWYLGAGRERLAIPYLEFAVRGRPDDHDLLNTLGYIYAENDMKLDESIELVRRALAVTPPDAPQQILGFYRDSLGWAYYKLGEMDSALVHIEAAVELAPETAEIRLHLIDLYADLGRIDDASAMLVDELVAARGVDADLRVKLRRLHRTTPQGRPIAAELEVERRVREIEAAEIEAIESLGGRVIRLEADDGHPLQATLFRTETSAPAPAVVLVHMAGSDRSVYRSLGRRLAQSGVHALSLDVRGHGSSISESIPNLQRFGENLPDNFRGAVLDVTAAVEALRQDPAVDAERLAVVGASMGGVWALFGTREVAAVRAVVVLSPDLQLDYEEAVRLHRDSPMLFVASTADAAAVEAAERLHDQLDTDRTRVVTYEDAGHGTDMLERVPELEPFLVRWIQGTLLDLKEL